MRLAIVCPTRDRLTFLERSLDFLSLYNIEAKYIIVDSSENKSAYSLFTEYSNALRSSKWKIEYISMPCNSRDAYTWTVKMYKTFQNIDAKYAVIDSDDDFLDYNFVHSCMHIMDQNPFIAAENGVVHDFSLISTPATSNPDFAN